MIAARQRVTGRRHLIQALLLPALAPALLAGCRGSAQDSAPVSVMAPASPATGAGLPGFAGAASCAPCHAAAHADWKETPHARTVRAPDAGDRALLDRSLLCAGEQPALVMGERHARRYMVPAAHAPGRHDLLACRWDVGPAEWATVEVAEGRAGTWEESCAACHTTGFASDSITYTELTVGCESCHGPASRHATSPGKGSMVAFAALTPAQEVTICAACHLQGGRSRRTGRPYAFNPIAGEPLFDDLEFDWGSLEQEVAPGASPIDHHQKLLIRDLAREASTGASGAGEPGLRCTACHSVHRADHSRHERLERQPFCYLCHDPEGFHLKEYRQSCSLCEF